MDRAISYRDLEIYQIAHRLAVEVHRITLMELPRFEFYEEGSQVRKSSKSVSTNIVEGFGRRRYKAEYIHFLVYAHASCDETLEHLMYLKDTGSFAPNHCDQLLTEYETLSRKICKFILRVQEMHQIR